jgi:hypothetical protein
VLGELPLEDSLPQLWVERDDEHARARELIHAYFKDTPAPAVACPACGEENPGSFELCWNCGRGLEGRA